jgi:predicted transcriptional regulator of viral defense system
MIRDHRLRVFTTSDLLTLTGLSRSAAAHALRRMASRRLVRRIKRGLWMNDLAQDISPYEIVPHLVAPWPAYVSLYSALADYGVVQEIPQIIYAVTSSRTRRYQTPLGSFHFHHLPARLIWGYEMKQVGRASYPIAEPEKAFLDLAYLALIPRSPLELPHRRSRKWNLDARKLKAYAARFQFPPITASLRRLLQ